MTPEEMADKLERQPLHERGVYISWQTRDELVDLLRCPNAAEAERDKWEPEAALDATAAYWRALQDWRRTVGR